MKLLPIIAGIFLLAACSPPEPSAEPIINAKKPIDKAKNVEKILLDQNRTIDQTIEKSNTGQ